MTSTYCRFEVLMGSLIVGVLELMVAVMAMVPNELEPLYLVLAVRGVSEEFATILGLLSLMVVWGSIRPKRTCRHMGLALSGVMLLIVFGVVLTSKWFSLSAGVLLVLALASFGLYAADAHIHVTERRRLNAEGPGTTP